MKKEINGKTYELVKKDNSKPGCCQQCAFYNTDFIRPRCKNSKDITCCGDINNIWKEVKDAD